MSFQQSQQICQFFLKGTCRFGNKCKNRHVNPQQGQQGQPAPTVEITGPEKSVYPPFNLIAGTDLSVEELRLQFYTNPSQYVSSIQGLTNAAMMKKKKVLDNADRYALECMAKARQPQSQSQQSVVPHISAFGKPSNSAFGNPQSVSVFNTGPPASSAFGPQTTPVFANQAPPFQQQNSGFGQTGLNNTRSSIFGQPPAPVTTGVNAFGGNTQQSVFGGGQQQSVFGGTQQPSVFGGAFSTQQKPPQTSFITQQQSTFQTAPQSTSSHPVWGCAHFEFGQLPTTEPPPEER